MYSAFGVDHGYDEEFEKAFGMGALRSLGTGIGQTARTGAKAMGGMAGKNIATGGVRGTLGRAQVGIGRGLKKVSNFAAGNPAAAGGAAVGTGAAGIGGAGFMAGRSGGDNKKLSQYR